MAAHPALQRTEQRLAMRRAATVDGRSSSDDKTLIAVGAGRVVRRGGTTGSASAHETPVKPAVQMHTPCSHTPLPWQLAAHACEAQS